MTAIFIFSLLTVIFYMFGFGAIGTILLIITIVLIVYKTVSAREENRLQKAIRKREQEQREAQDLRLNNVIIPSYKRHRKELIEKYGSPTKSFIFQPYNLNEEIIAFEESKRIWICGRDFPMKDILSCTFTDNSKVVKGRIISTTNTDNGSMIGRAVVGDILFGGVGAVIGGATANQSTISTQENDQIYHDYTVIVNVDSIAEPLVRIHIGDDVKTTNEVVGLLNVIINRRHNLR